MVLHTRVVAGSGGGPDKTIMRSPRYVDPAKLRMAAAYIHPAGDEGIETIREQAAEFGCPLHLIPERGPMDPRTIRSLLDLCRKLDVSIWHGHDYKSNLLGLLLRRWHPMKLVTTLHGWTNETARTRLYYHVDNLCLPRYEQLIAVSPQLHEHCRGFGLNEDRLTYVPNAIELNDYPIRPRRTGNRMRLTVGVVGRLSVEKGADRAIGLIRAMGMKYPDLHLDLIGDGPQRTILTEQARKYGVDRRVHFLGWRTDTKKLYEQMDVLLLPSHTEGLPNVVLEAMAIGVPVAATDVGAVREVIDDGRCGVILDPKDTSGWAQQIEPLLVSEDRRDELARRGRARVEERYSFEARMAKVFAVYDRLLPTRTATPVRRAA